jgi:predicted secreted protein
MPTFILNSVTTWVGGHDFTCDTNSIALSVEVDEQDNTTFCSRGWRSRIGGLRSVSADLEGFWQAGSDAVDPHTFSTLAVAGLPVTISPTGVEGDVAYMFQGGKFSYEMFGDLGEVAPFSLSMLGTEGREGLIRGRVAAARQTVDSTGAIGSPVQLGAGAAGKYLYAVLHTFSAGATISVKVESDNAQAFSDPADVASATIGPVTAVGGTWMTRIDASGIVDDWFRISVTAITGEFSVAAALAIQ